jgi:hypothetical protein
MNKAIVIAAGSIALVAGIIGTAIVINNKLAFKQLAETTGLSNKEVERKVEEFKKNLRSLKKQGASPEQVEKFIISFYAALEEGSKA